MWICWPGMAWDWLGGRDLVLCLLSILAWRCGMGWVEVKCPSLVYIVLGGKYGRGVLWNRWDTMATRNERTNVIRRYGGCGLITKILTSSLFPLLGSVTVYLLIKYAGDMGTTGYWLNARSQRERQGLHKPRSERTNYHSIFLVLASCLLNTYRGFTRSRALRAFALPSFLRH